MTNKTDAKKEVDDILDQLMFECYKIIDTYKTIPTPMQVVKQSIYNISSTKTMTQGHGEIQRNKVLFQIGEETALPIFSEEDYDDEN